jgi:hypothetical protein
MVVEIGDYMPGAGPNNGIVGKVKSFSKDPIANATVIARNIDDFSKTIQTRSDSAGKFILDPARWGRYIIYAQKPGFNISTPVMVETRNSQQLEITLPPKPK